MERIFIAVGSARAPKLRAVSEALQAFGSALHANAEYEVVGIAVASGVAHTPTSRVVTMAGARARAQAVLHLARERAEPWRYFVGLEGGLEVIPRIGNAPPDAAVSSPGTPSAQNKRWVFLENWAFVTDGQGRESYGHAGGILLPQPLAASVLDDGVELSTAIDAYAGGSGIRDAQGAWGVLTRNLITRQDTYRMAVMNAFAPFYNAALYSGSAPRGE